MKFDRPPVALEDSNAVLSRFRVVDRKGTAQVVLSGDTGDLKLSKRVDAVAAENTDISLQGSGSEQSDCLPAFNNWNSSASGTATVQPFEISGLRLRLKAAANGGHYTKAISCILKNPVGFTPIDTSASSSVLAEGTITFETQSVPFDLRLAWREMPPLSEIRLLNPLSQIQAEIDSTSGSEKSVQIDKVGTWQVKLRVGIDAKASGDEQKGVSAQPLIFLESR